MASTTANFIFYRFDSQHWDGSNGISNSQIAHDRLSTTFPFVICKITSSLAMGMAWQAKFSGDWRDGCDGFGFGF